MSTIRGKTRAGTDFLILLKSDVIMPMDVGTRIAQKALVAKREELVGFETISDEIYENTELSFEFDLPGGQAVTENDDNWGVGGLGYNAQRLWALGGTGRRVRIGIADSGLDAAHPTFSSLRSDHRLAAFAAFSANGSKAVQHGPDGSLIPDAQATPTFTHWHGTFCSAILVGETTDSKARGMAPEAELAVAQVLQQANNGTVASIFAGLSWLVDQECDVVSLSLGWDGRHDQWNAPVQALLSRGTVVVAAIGNSFGVPGVEPSDSPANYPIDSTDPNQGLLISVGAIDQTDHVADFSGGGLVDWSTVVNRRPDGTTSPSPFASSPPRTVPLMVGPGVGVVSASPGTGYRLESGTSMATPHVAGLIALILSLLRTKNPTATPRSAANLLLSSLAPLNADRSGHGKVDLDLILEHIKAFQAGLRSIADV